MSKLNSCLTLIYADPDLCALRTCTARLGNAATPGKMGCADLRFVEELKSFEQSN